jgi:hypothetical protein
MLKGTSALLGMCSNLLLGGGSNATVANIMIHDA